MKDYYQILDIPPNATQAKIKERYHFLAQAWHPDKFAMPAQKAEAEEKFKEIRDAYEIIVNPDKRAQYDITRSSYSSQSDEEDEQRQRDEAEVARRYAEEELQRAEHEQQREAAEAERRQKEQAESERLRAQRERSREKLTWRALPSHRRGIVDMLFRIVVTTFFAPIILVSILPIVGLLKGMDLSEIMQSSPVGAYLFGVIAGAIIGVTVGVVIAAASRIASQWIDRIYVRIIVGAIVGATTLIAFVVFFPHGSQQTIDKVLTLFVAATVGAFDGAIGGLIHKVIRYQPYQ